MIHIDLINNPPDAIWIAKADGVTQQLINAKNANDDDLLKKIITDNAKLWGELKAYLEKLSFGKCWYSEAREVYSHYHVDHFRPKNACIDLDKKDKGGYWWLAFVWKNYRICGSVGNVKKRDKFAVKTNRATGPDSSLNDEIIYLLDPIIKSDPKKLTFNEDGSISPANPNKKTFEYQQANYTIKVLKLTHDKLETERRRIWRKCTNKIDETRVLKERYNANPSADDRAKIENNENWFREHLAPCTEFSAVYKNCLKKSGEDWAYELLAENLDIKELCKDYND